MRILSICPYIMVALISLPKTHPITAAYKNNMSGPGQIVLEETTRYMESWSHSRFLHSQEPDLFITIRWADLPDDVLGIAFPRPGACNVAISNQMNPDSPQFNHYSNLYIILIHEIGHCFGLMHSDDENQIMYYAPTNILTKEMMSDYIKELNKARGIE